MRMKSRGGTWYQRDRPDYKMWGWRDEGHGHQRDRPDYKMWGWRDEEWHGHQRDRPDYKMWGWRVEEGHGTKGIDLIIKYEDEESRRDMVNNAIRRGTPLW